MKKDIIIFEKEGFVCLQKVYSKTEIDNNFKGYFIDNPNEKEIRKIVDSFRKNKKVLAVQSYDNKLNRRILETMKIDYLVFPEKVEKKDTLKQRDSGINHVIAKIAKDNEISFLINFNEIKNSESKNRILLLSRIIQNLKICRKAKTKIKIASLAEKESQITEPREMQDFLLSLGASTKQAKEAVIY